MGLLAKGLKSGHVGVTNVERVAQTNILFDSCSST